MATPASIAQQAIERNQYTGPCADVGSMAIETLAIQILPFIASMLPTRLV
jgi:hypothetical protein